MASPNMPPVATAGFPAAHLAWRAVFILCVATTLSYIDRQLIYVLVEPMRATLAISDTQISILQGLSFALFFTTMGVFLGSMADKNNRKNLIIGGVLTWSLMTILCGLCDDFWTLFLCRAGVGAGEAALMPASISLLSDYFPPERRGRAMSSVYLCTGLGAGLSFFLGGEILHQIPGTSVVHFPIVGELHGWQVAFVVAGLPGFAVALLVLFLSEVPRREQSKGRSIVAAMPIWTHPHFRKHWRALLCMFAAGTSITLVGYAIAAWMTVYLVRAFDIPIRAISLQMGMVSIVAAIGGGIAGGIVSDRLAKWRTGGRIYIYPICVTLVMPVAISWVLVPDVRLAVGLLLINTIVINTAIYSSSTMLQEIVPNEIRGITVGAYTMSLGIFSAGFGPMSVALLTDHLFGRDAAVGWSILLVALPALTFSAGAAMFGARPYAAARAAVLAQAR